MLSEGSIEYPVLTGLFIWGTAQVAGSYVRQYLSLNAALLGAIALVVAYALALLAGWRALMWALAPAVVLYAFHNWDLLAVGAMLAGIWSWSRNRRYWASAWFGIGVAFKLFPGALLVPLSFNVCHDRGKGAGLRILLVGLAVAVGINLPFAIANPAGWAATYRFQQERGPNYSSIWTLATPSWSPALVNSVSGLLLLVSFAGILAYTVHRARREGAFPFLEASGALIAALMLWGKVQSPQYILWILPFLVLLDVRIWWWLAYTVVDLMLYVSVFGPISAAGQWEARPWVWLSVFGRAAILGGLMIAFARTAPASGFHKPVRWE
jgi:uncharacterized membrane protein